VHHDQPTDPAGQPSAPAARTRGSLPGYRGTVIFSDHHPDVETRNTWVTLPDAHEDDQDDQLEDEHLDPVRTDLLNLVLHNNPHPPLLQAHAAPVEGRTETFAIVTSVDDVPGRDRTVWVVLWLDDDHELTVLEHADCLDALTDFRHHVRGRDLGGAGGPRRRWGLRPQDRARPPGNERRTPRGRSASRWPPPVIGAPASLQGASAAQRHGAQPLALRGTTSSRCRPATC
jgi:hypothetical protein